MPTVRQPSEFLTAFQVRARYGVGRMWIERRIKQSGFPRPFKFGGVSAVRITAVNGFDPDTGRAGLRYCFLQNRLQRCEAL